MRLVVCLGLLAALLAQVQLAHAFIVDVTRINCNYLYVNLTVTTPESSVAEYLALYPGPTNMTQIALAPFNNVYMNTNSYTFIPSFNQPISESGAQQITFRLLDDNEAVIAAYPQLTETINFQCGTTVVTSSAASSTPTGSSSSGNSGSGSNSGSSSDSNNAASSGSSSSTGAIAGGVVGGVVAFLIVGLLAFCLMKRKKKQRAQQTRLRNNEADEAAFRAPNNDSTASLATAPETANTPMMRDVSTKNVFADPTASTASGAPSGSSTLFTANNQAAYKPSSGSGIGAGAATAAAAGGIGAAAIAARKQSREQSRVPSPGHESVPSPSSESFKSTPYSQVPPPVPALPASAAASTAPVASQPTSQSSKPATYPTISASDDSASKPGVAGAAAASAAAVGAGAAAGAAAKKASSDNKPKVSKWGFKRASKDETSTSASTSKAPYPQAVAEPAVATSSAPAPPAKLAPEPVASPTSSSSSPSSISPEVTTSPSRSFKVIQKPSSPGPASTAGPSNASITPSENSLSRATPAFSPRSGHATPAGSIRGNNYSRAPSVASMTAGFADAPPMPSGAASVSSMPTSELGGNMAGIGAGRSFAASSGNSTKWHQQSYNVMPNFSHRALARSTQLDEDLIFGHLGMGLTPPPGPAGNGSESGSSKSRTDPFGDR